MPDILPWFKTLRWVPPAPPYEISKKVSDDSEHDVGLIVGSCVGSYDGFTVGSDVGSVVGSIVGSYIKHYIYLLITIFLYFIVIRKLFVVILSNHMAQALVLVFIWKHS